MIYLPEILDFLLLTSPRAQDPLFGPPILHPECFLLGPTLNSQSFRLQRLKGPIIIASLLFSLEI